MDIRPPLDVNLRSRTTVQMANLRNLDLMDKKLSVQDNYVKCR